MFGVDRVNLEKVDYSSLNAKAKEMYNFQKVSAVLADYGFTTMWLNNDWQGADFIAIHIDGITDMKVQLKGRLSFNKKYLNKNIYICFINNKDTYLYPHDLLLNKVIKNHQDKTWAEHGIWSSPRLTKFQIEQLKNYKI